MTAQNHRYVAAAVAAGTCPWCGAGPFQKLATHTVRKHGITADEIRSQMGLGKRAQICAPEHSAKLRAVFGDLEDTRGHSYDAASKRAQEQREAWLGSAQDSDALAEFARAAGKTTAQMRERLRVLGLPLPAAPPGKSRPSTRRALTRGQVIQARRRAAAGESHADIAKSLGVSRPTVSKAVSREIYGGSA